MPTLDFFSHTFLMTIRALAAGPRLFGALLALVLLSPPTLAENTAPSKSIAPAPHIALLLPLQAPAFRAAAEAVKEGFVNAAKLASDAPEIRIYPTSEDVDAILASYQFAVANGARVVVGPLTKNAVLALAEADITLVPTLALSVPDSEITRANFYLFGLSLDAEARQMATYIARAGYRSLLIVGGTTPLDKRLQATVGAAWQQLGLQLLPSLVYTPNGDLNAMRERLLTMPADAIFLAANMSEARILRPYLAPGLPSFATSLIFNGDSKGPQTVDLAGVRFLDMPWLLQPDHPAVMIYPRGAHDEGDAARLYAMGIDALRLALLFYRGPTPMPGVVLDGVTGQISLNAQRQFTRELTPAEIQANAVLVLDNAQP